ncbi:MAG: ATP-NAD kinase [Methanomassiliicoccales archaeon PtaU1.Bin124]|nr:MAG: ATP-NAD kinase [Methanomassiliicoccales archaeon PtaU1.Bin124]
MRLGLVINPIAGMGGAIGLKGSDGLRSDVALAKGGRFVAEDRAQAALSNVEGISGNELITASGSMGEDLLRRLELVHKVVHHAKQPSTSYDTTAAVTRFLEEMVDLVIFCGGDGTAADVLAASPGKTVCLGIPAGVKMHSAVFANTPREAGALISRFIVGGMDVKEAEVMDIDEEAFRHGVLKAEIIGHLVIPDDSSLLQPPKGTIATSSDGEEKEELGEEFARTMKNDVLYVIGPGTTCAALAKAIGLDKTLLGVDLVKDGSLIDRDVDERVLLRMIEVEDKVEIIVTPIGRQGFIFGRGNQQISAEVLRRITPKNVIVYATPSKLRSLDHLRVDTGDASVDALFKGHIKVRTGFSRQRVIRVE